MSGHAVEFAANENAADWYRVTLVTPDGKVPLGEIGLDSRSGWTFDRAKGSRAAAAIDALGGAAGLLRDFRAYCKRELERGIIQTSKRMSEAVQWMNEANSALAAAPDIKKLERLAEAIRHINAVKAELDWHHERLALLD